MIEVDRSSRGHPYREIFSFDGDKISRVEVYVAATCWGRRKFLMRDPIPLGVGHV
jgi:hypothetical protein